MPMGNGMTGLQSISTDQSLVRAWLAPELPWATQSAEKVQIILVVSGWSLVMFCSWTGSGSSAFSFPGIS